MENKKIVFKELDWFQMRDHLIRDDNLEWAAFAFITKDSENPNQFFVTRILLIESEGYAFQSPVFNSLKDETMVDLINEIKSADEMGIMEIHSHPFANIGIFSSVDNENYPGFRNDILRRKQEGFMLRMVIGQAENGFTCYYTNPQSGKEESIPCLSIIGRNRLKKIKRFSKAEIFSKESFVDISRKFLRNKQVFGKKGSEAISQITLGCIAAGGVMNPFILEAAHAGFRKFRIVDFDHVEEINFNRLLGLKYSDIGKYKVDIMERELKQFDPDIEVSVLKKNFHNQEAQIFLNNTDILIGGVDNDEARLAIQIYASRLMKPFFDMGSGIYLNDSLTKIEQKGSQTRIYIPGYSCLVCQGLDLDKIHSETYVKAKSAAGYIINANETPGSVITLNATIASMTLSLLVDYVTGNNTIPLHLSYDELNYNMKTHNFGSRYDCPFCGKMGIVGHGMERNMPDGGLDELPDGNTIINSQNVYEEV